MTGRSSRAGAAARAGAGRAGKLEEADGRLTKRARAGARPAGLASIAALARVASAAWWATSCSASVSWMVSLSAICCSWLASAAAASVTFVAALACSPGSVRQLGLGAGAQWTAMVAGGG